MKKGGKGNKREREKDKKGRVEVNTRERREKGGERWEEGREGRK